MKVLMVTQKVDTEDDLLWVYHNWIRSFAKKIEKLNVICLFLGKFNLPENVSVFSLGKESGRSKIKYLINFFYYIFRLRRDYDIVFVHMNKEYILLAGLLWRLMGKKIVFWYAHYHNDWQLKIAAFLSDKILTSVRSAFPFATKKLISVGQGIDVDFFKQNKEGYRIKKDLCLLSLGRISPRKDIGTLIRAGALLKKENINFLLEIVGAPPLGQERYLADLKKAVEKNGLNERVRFLGRADQSQVLIYYNECDIFINLSETGFFDKTVLEAMACERPVLVCNKAFFDILPEALQKLLIFKEQNEEDLMIKIKSLAKLEAYQKEAIGKQLRELVVKNHSLPNLTEKIYQTFNEL